MFARLLVLALGLWPRTFDPEGMAEAGARAAQGAICGMIQVPISWDFLAGRQGETYHTRYDYMFAPIWGGQDYFSHYQIKKAIWLDFLVSDRRFLSTSGSFQDPYFAQCFVNECAFLADYFQPDYFALGTEIDEYLRCQSPAEADALYQTLHIAMSQIRVIHPRCLVFVYFQYENVVQRDLWTNITPFVQISDVAGFSSYPVLLGYNGDTLPLDYYDAIEQHLRKPIVFAEFGHPARPCEQFPNGSEEDQQKFVKRWFEACPRTTKLATWFAIFDPNYGGQAPLFETMGLLRTEEETPAWREWLSHQNTGRAHGT